MLNRKGIYAILALLGFFWLLHLGLSPQDQTTRVIIATLLGGSAFLLMTVSILLSTRMPVLENLFGGLDRMYQVHKICGVLSAGFVLIHFFAAPKALPEGVDISANPLTPSAPFGMIALILLVVFLAISLNRKIAYHRWRPAHKAMGLVYFLIIGHFMSAPAIFVDQFSASGLVLVAAAIVGVLSYCYSIFGMNKRTSVDYEIEAVNHLERATEVVLKPIADGIDHHPGQFAFIEIKAKSWSEPHPFTISSAPGDDRLRFTIKVLGDWIRRVREELEPGVKVQVRGPYGCFNMTKGRKKQIWVAGGIGLTPFLSAIRAMKPGDGRDIHLVYASRNETDALFLPELQELAAKLKNVTLVPLFSDEGNFARVDMMKQALPEPLSTYDYFLCGPRPMTAGFTKDLQSETVPRNNIHTEAFEFR